MSELHQLFDRLWNSVDQNVFPHLEVRFTSGHVEQFSLREILIFLSKPVAEDDLRGRDLKVLDSILNSILNTSELEEETQTHHAFLILARCLTLFRKVIPADFAKIASKYLDISRQLCVGELRPLILYNLSRIHEEEKSTDPNSHISAIQITMEAYNLYFMQAEGEESAELNKAGDALERSCITLWYCLDSRVLDPKHLQPQILKAKDSLGEYLELAPENEKSYLLLAFKGYFHLHSHEESEDSRISQCTFGWTLAMSAAEKTENVGALLFTAQLIERNSFLIRQNPKSIELAQYASVQLDHAFVLEGFQRNYVLYKNSVLKAKSHERRMEILSEIGPVISPSFKEIQKRFEDMFSSFGQAEVLFDKIAGLPFDAKKAAYYQDISNDRANTETKKAMAKIEGSRFAKKIADYLKSGRPFGLYLRNVGVESHARAKTRPRTYHFDDCLIENYTAQALQMQVQRDTASLEKILSTFNFISIENILDMLNKSAVDTALVENDIWREIVFSLIGEAAVIVMALPAEFEFSTYNGIMEEREVISSFEANDRTICVRVEEGETGLPDDIFESMVFPGMEPQRHKITGGSMMAPRFSKEQLNEMFPLTKDASVSNWAAHSLSTDKDSLAQLQVLLSSYLDR